VARRPPAGLCLRQQLPHDITLHGTLPHLHHHLHLEGAVGINCALQQCCWVAVVMDDDGVGGVQVSRWDAGMGRCTHVSPRVRLRAHNRGTPNHTAVAATMVTAVLIASACNSCLGPSCAYAHPMHSPLPVVWCCNFHWLPYQHKYIKCSAEPSNIWSAPNCINGALLCYIKTALSPHPLVV
jgi:hypothetical protein